MTAVQPVYVLLVEDDEDDFILARSFLDDAETLDYRLSWVRTIDEAQQHIEREPVDIVLLDYRLGKRDGVSFAEHLAAVDHPAPIIMLTGQASLDIDLEAMRVGVSDFLPKDELTSGHLDRSIRYALRQRQGVQAVRASREFLRQALDALPQSIAILDEVGRIVAVNRQWRQFADLEGFNAPDYGVGMNYLSVCENTTGPDSLDAARVSDAIRRTISGEDPGFVLEYPCHSDEEQRWFEVTVSSFLADGSQRVIVAHENITRRIVAEREHFAVARTMETLMTSSPAAIVGVDREARITLWSPAAERLFGWSKEEVIGKLNPLFSDGEREKMLDYHQRVLDGEIVIGREGYRLKKDGDFVPVHVSVARIESFDGEPIGALGIFLDLTSRLEVEQELKRREQQYRTLVETLPDSIVRYDRDLRRVFGNPAANSTVSVPVVDGKPPHLSELGLSCEQLQGWVARIQEALETGSPSDHEWFTTLGGTGRYFDTRVIPEPGMDGKPESVLVVSRDITERRQRESERQLLAKASAQLAATLDFDETLSTIMELMVPEFADVCSISLFDEGPVPIRRVALVKAGQDGLGVVHPDFQESEIEPVGDYGIPRVYQTGESVVYERVDIEQVIQSTFPVELRSAARNLDQRSAMFVPLKVRARVIGAMGFAFGTSGRRYTEDDLPFAEDLANRAAIAIDNARLYKDLERSEERHRTLVEQIPAVVFTADADDLSRPRYLSPQIEQITGYSAGEFTDGRLTWYDVVHPDDRAFVMESDEATLLSGTSRTLDYRILTRDNRTIWVHEDARLIFDSGASAGQWQGILNDVTIQKDLESQLIHQAFHDTLTGLPNRALFNNRVRHAQERRHHGSDIAVCFMDLDNFKVINDSLGHSVGDELLIQVAARLQKCVRGDDTAARFGGDEFALLLEGINSLAAVTRTVTRVVSAFDDPFIVNGRELFITPSVGVAVASPDDIAHRDLLREADAAMYKAKRAGKARFELYNRTLTVDAVNRLDVETDLRKTLNGEQLEMHYQPVVDLPGGEITGVEALVRWIHPEHGMIPPDRFIPIAEETAMIVDLGRWILEESCRRVKSWNDTRQDGAPLHLSVNLSARQFTDALLVDDVRSILERTGFAPDLLCLEITETVMTEDEDAAARVLRRLKTLGIRIAVDDFGVGYSSLTSLRKFPVDILKIDRSFVGGLVDDPNDSVIVSGVIGLAHALELEVIAEGVETEEQRDQLVELRCDLAQGFMFEKPIEAGVFEQRYIRPRVSVTGPICVPVKIHGPIFSSVAGSVAE